MLYKTTSILPSSTPPVLTPALSLLSRLKITAFKYFLQLLQHNIMVQCVVKKIRQHGPDLRWNKPTGPKTTWLLDF